MYYCTGTLFKRTVCAALLSCCLSTCVSVWALDTHENMQKEAAASDFAAAVAGQEQEPVFRVTRQASWLFRSFLRDEEDDADTLGLEFESVLNFGHYQMKNISYFEVNQFPRSIPGQPPGNGESDVTVPEEGIGDLLAGFWFSKRGEHHGKHHFAPGFAMQFPTADDDSLGTGKYAMGPSFDYE